MNALWPLVALAGLLGLAIGSFLNVVIYRVPRHESIVAPASRCPSCDTTIKNRHKIPVLSWLLLRGRCAYCTVPISPRYLVVEALTGALFAALTEHFGLRVELPAYLYLAAVGVTLAAIDLDRKQLPDRIVLSSYVVSVLLLMPAGAGSGDWSTAVRALCGAAGFAAICVPLVLLFPGGLDFDDVKVAALVGLYLGWIGWSTLGIGAFGGLLLVAVTGAVASVAGPVAGSAAADSAGGGAKDVAVAAAPCLLAAAVVSVFVAAPLARWYGSLVSRS